MRRHDPHTVTEGQALAGLSEFHIASSDIIDPTTGQQTSKRKRLLGIPRDSRVLQYMVTAGDRMVCETPRLSVAVDTYNRVDEDHCS